jgi:Protein of unknown function (DUF4239)
VWPVSRWLVSDVPSWLLLAGLIIAIVGGSVLVQVYVRKRFPRLKDGAHNDVTKFVYGVVGFVYAFFIGFVVSAMWGEVNIADDETRSEGAYGVQLARDIYVFDEADADRIRRGLLEYEKATMAEWPHLANGQRVSDADEALHRLYVAYTDVEPRTDTQKTFLATSFSNLNHLSKARTERVDLATSDTGPPWSLWVVIFLTSGLVLGCSIVYGVENAAMHYPMVATVGVLVAANTFLIVQLSHPLAGDIATSPAPLSEVVQVISPR